MIYGSNGRRSGQAPDGREAGLPAGGHGMWSFTGDPANGVGVIAGSSPDQVHAGRDWAPTSLERDDRERRAVPLLGHYATKPVVTAPWLQRSLDAAADYGGRQAALAQADVRRVQTQGLQPLYYASASRQTGFARPNPAAVWESARQARIAKVPTHPLTDRVEAAPPPAHQQPLRSASRPGSPAPSVPTKKPPTYRPGNGYLGYSQFLAQETAAQAGRPAPKHHPEARPNAPGSKSPKFLAFFKKLWPKPRTEEQPWPHTPAPARQPRNQEPDFLEDGRVNPGGGLAGVLRDATERAQQRPRGDRSQYWPYR